MVEVVFIHDSLCKIFDVLKNTLERFCLVSSAPGVLCIIISAVRPIAKF